MDDNFYSKEEWIKMKNRERDATYRKIDTSANNTLKDEKLFVQYLDLQSKFNQYSVGNILLISYQMPETTQFKDKEGWAKIGAKVNTYAKGFTILEPTNPYVKEDGTKATYYNPKKMYDITQTDAKQSDIAKTYTDNSILKALISDSKVQIEVVDEIDGVNTGASYKEAENKLYICRGMEIPYMFQSISSEIAKSELQNTGKNTLNDFESYCISYMICKKYGIDVSNYNFDVLPQEIKNMDCKGFRYELGMLRDTFNNINSKMENSLEKNAKNKDKER